MPRRRAIPAPAERYPRLDAAKRTSRYASLSTRPLHILVFLLPLIIAYEVGSFLYLRGDDGAVQTILARRILGDVFYSFGVSSLHIPAILTIAILIIWHFFTRDRWRVRPKIIVAMWIEAAAWTLPLLVLGLLLSRALGIDVSTTVSFSQIAGDAPPPTGDWKTAVTIAIGAGVYEELLFRMLGIALIHFITVDLLLTKEMTGRIVAVVITSIAFAYYHDAADWPLRFYYFAAGAYFATLYLFRSLGIVVAVHAIFDIIVLTKPFG